MYEILDVSRYQHPGNHAIDWRAVASAGIRAVYVKATEGLTYVNPSLHADVLDARAAGLEVGAYLFLRGDDGAAQARWFLEHTEGLPLTLAPAIDVEVGHSEMANVLCACLHVVEAETGPAIIYTYEHFQAALAGRPEFGTRPLWLAAYRSSPPVPAGPWQGKEWAIWQFTGKGRCPGIVGDVDVSRARELPLRVPAEEAAVTPRSG